MLPGVLGIASHAIVPTNKQQATARKDILVPFYERENSLSSKMTESGCYVGSGSQEAGTDIILRRVIGGVIGE
jgi:hypothetical protein